MVVLAGLRPPVGSGIVSSGVRPGSTCRRGGSDSMGNCTGPHSTKSKLDASLEGVLAEGLTPPRVEGWTDPGGSQPFWE